MWIFVLCLFIIIPKCLGNASEIPHRKNEPLSVTLACYLVRCTQDCSTGHSLIFVLIFSGIYPSAWEKVLLSVLLYIVQIEKATENKMFGYLKKSVFLMLGHFISIQSRVLPTWLYTVSSLALYVIFLSFLFIKPQEFNSNRGCV